MGFAVSESIEARTRGESQATRTYIAKWDGLGETNPNVARTAIINYLDTLVESYATGVIRQLGPDPDSPGAFERRLTYWLHGFAAKSAPCEEVAQTRGRYYQATVTWESSSNEGNFDSNLDDQLGDGDNASVKVSYGIAGAAKGAAIDQAPIRWLFSRQRTGGPLDTVKAPAYPPGSLNPVQSESDGSIQIRGLEYSAPQATLNVRLELSGSAPQAAFIRRLKRAADAGTVNSAAYTIAGIAFEPAELCFVGFSAETSEGGGTNCSLGFSSGTVTDLDVTVSGGIVLADLSAFVAGDDTTFMLWSDTDVGGEAAPEADATLKISPWDYVHTFHEKQTITEDGTPRDVRRIENVSINRIWPEDSYETIFGVASL